MDGPCWNGELGGGGDELFERSTGPGIGCQFALCMNSRWHLMCDMYCRVACSSPHHITTQACAAAWIDRKPGAHITITIDHPPQRTEKPWQRLTKQDLTAPPLAVWLVLPSWLACG